MREAIKSDRTTVYNAINDAGHPELAELIRRLYMAFNGNFMCTSFKKELLYGVHDFDNSSGDTFKIALYTNSASFTAATTAYTTSNEVSGTGYTAGVGP